MKPGKERKPGLPTLHERPAATNKQQTSVQRIEAATVKKWTTQVRFSEKESLDAEALFNKFDVEGTGLLSRGALIFLLREIGLEKVMGDQFSASARLAFDAHSADSHFLSLPEFKQMYYLISSKHPELLPRSTRLTITILSAKGLPPADPNGKSDPYCICQVVGKPASKSQTRHIDKTLDPWWGEEFDDKYGYDDGDPLLFEVWDYERASGGELLCRTTLASSEFHRPGGFDGKLKLSDACPKGYSPTLKVKVEVQGMPPAPPNLRIQMLSAKGLPPADLNGKADPYCLFEITGKPYSKYQTKRQNKTLEPVWNEECDDKYRYEEGDDLLFSVYDWDKGTKGGNDKAELLGKAVLKNSEFHKPGGFSGDLPLTEVLLKGYNPTISLKVTVLALEEPPPVAAAPAPTGSKEGALEGDGGVEATAKIEGVAAVPN